jgi:hypothetical protein
VNQNIRDHDAAMAAVLASLPGVQAAQVAEAQDQLFIDQNSPSSDFAGVDPSRPETAWQVAADYLPSWKTAAYIVGGAALCMVPGIGPVLLTVGGGLLMAGGVASSAVSRSFDRNQTLSQAFVGATADVTGVATLYAGLTNTDIASGAHLGLTIAQQRQSITDGAIQTGMTAFGAAQGARRFVSGRPALAPCPCFPAGTPIRTLAGSKPIEQIRADDRVLSVPEHDPAGAVEGKRVEEVFVRVAPVMRLLLGGREIRVTAEHPFYVEERGWVAAGLLAVGDRLHTLGGGRLRLTEVEDAGEVTTVYNFRVAEYATYFVGDESWEYAIWTHNSYDSRVLGKALTANAQPNTLPGGQAAHVVPVGRFTGRTVRVQNAVRNAKAVECPQKMYQSE